MDFNGKPVWKNPTNTKQNKLLASSKQPDETHGPKMQQLATELETRKK